MGTGEVKRVNVEVERTQMVSGVESHSRTPELFCLLVKRDRGRP